MCFCTSKKVLQQRDLFIQLTSPIQLIYPQVSLVYLVNAISQNIIFEHGYQETDKDIDLNNIIHTHQQSQNLAILFKEKACPIIHFEKDDILTSVYSLKQGNLLVFHSHIVQDLNGCDIKMQNILIKLIEAMSEMD
ncbi:hypothetical protein SS50377_26307 [Spironucleus salmonicida]|uniref:Uncharacterized protein n=1 Tax=Spironucleus salmonicida TaxID=348837 RepID=V6LT54_9EUKA|nr:hypothetical protein SS50377_26307 [Spironucleus salmonicida]|eukprot:EST47827.1 Hypothetical protein SS50377_12228 [Spironucleus salmonicida]